jgi:hypothetical protein
MRLRINFDHDIYIAAGPAVAARTRAKEGGVAHAARAQGGFVLPQFGDDLLFVYKSYHINPA